MYKIDFDQRFRLMTITTWGFWSLGTMAAFTTAAITHATTTRLRHGAFSVLVDMRRAPIQKPEVMAATDAVMAGAARLVSGRIAAVVSTTLSKLQAERALTVPRCRTFLDYDEALAWVEADHVLDRAA